MFEEEAEEYKDNTRIKDKNTYIGFPDERISELQDFEGNYIDISERIIKTFKDGAEFGYNKAKEEDKWHYPSKGEYPDENKLVLIYAKNEAGYGHDFMIYHKDNGWYGYGTFIEEVIAWKELDIPKESE